MKKLIHTIIVLFASILISSCAKMEVVNFNKDNNTRTVKFTYDNGKTKIINQKLHLKSNNWFEAICYDKVFKLFKDCPNNKIDFTKVGKMQISQLENSKNKSSNNQQQSSNNQQQSSNNQQQSSDNQQQSSNNQQQSSNNQQQSSSGEEENEPDGPEPDMPDPLEPTETQGECVTEIC